MDYDKLTSEDLLDVEGLKQAFKEYAKRVLGYDDVGAEIASSDLNNPYDTPYIRQEYDGPATIDGVDYEVRECRTDFCLCGLYDLMDKPPFEFYMLFNSEDMIDNKVATYKSARKKYICVPLKEK